MATTDFDYQGAPPPPNYYPPPPKFQSGLPDNNGYQQQGLPYPSSSGYTFTTNTNYPSNVVVPTTQPMPQSTVVLISGVGQTTPMYKVESFSGQVALSCVVFWFCNVLFGLIAFILASIASNTAVADPNGARVLGRASYGMSIAGIVTSIIIVATVVGVIFGSPTYYYYGYY